MKIGTKEKRLLWRKPQVCVLVISLNTGFTKDGSCEDLVEPTAGLGRLKDGSCPIPPD
jgi:hypothetical protein